MEYLQPVRRNQPEGHRLRSLAQGAAHSWGGGEELTPPGKHAQGVRGGIDKRADTALEHSYQRRISGVRAGSAGMDAFDAFFTSESFELLSDGNRGVRSRCRKLRDLFYIQLIRINRRNSRGMFRFGQVTTVICGCGQRFLKFDDSSEELLI